MEKTFSKYAVIFEESCIAWTKDMALNRHYITHINNLYNDKLRRHGYVFLRDIFENLGIPTTQDSIICGWVYDANNPVGDNYIEIQVTELDDSKMMLDFNVYGNILPKFK